MSNDPDRQLVERLRALADLRMRMNCDGKGPEGG